MSTQAKQQLSGWQKLVYDLTPTSTAFTTSYLYGFEKDFRKQYPKNKNITAKIRQALQQLRDNGLLEHDEKNHCWKRV